jgi:hypothetical protein
MTGSWRGTLMGVPFESHFFLAGDAMDPQAAPRVLLGLTHAGPTPATGTSESIRIEPSGEGLLLSGEPVGLPPAKFNSVKVTDHDALFENVLGAAACPAPSSIHYELTSTGALRETVTWADTCSFAPPTHEITYEQTRHD